jgi:GntR family transcriptional repressor for pyruvate dehydrogenase complex
MSENLVFPRHVHSTIPDGIANEIQRQIAAGTLKDGDRLPSVETLAADFGVSRTSIREALRGLAALGIVTIQHGRGSFVCADIAKIDGYKAWIHEQQYALQELCEFRAAVETTAARLAAVKATDHDVASIAAALDHMREAVGNIHQVVVWDTEFHAAIIRCSHNRLIDQAISLNTDYLTQARYRMHSVPGEVEHALAAHAQILSAIAEKQPDAAAFAMREHLRAVERDLGIDVP